MNEFVRKIVARLTTRGKLLSVVKNPDGFLLRDDTQQKVLETSELLLLPIKSGFELRIRYELLDKHSGNSVCYIMDNPDEILPDIMSQLYSAPTFTLANLLPACDKLVLSSAKITFDMASYIYDKNIIQELTSEKTRFLLREAETLYGFDLQTVCDELRAIPLDWNKVKTIEQISNNLIKVIEKGKYHEIEPVIEELNANFQAFVDRYYFSFVNSSHIQKPKMVHKILPYLTNKHQRTEKIALLVIDGMTFWQYLILDKALAGINVGTKKDMTFAWLPSITKLSRQAIFRGEAPQMDYGQSPLTEERLWMDYCTAKRPIGKRMQRYEVGYAHSCLTINNDITYLQALVDISLDERMHSLDDNKDLFVLTKNWADNAANDIKAIHELGYQIYITTDHGNILANPWRSLSSQEKTFLYEKESRGNRHLIYSKTDYLNEFLQSNEEIKDDLLVHDNWAVWRNTKSFSNKKGITHGGAHFLEMVIPFITIEK